MSTRLDQIMEQFRSGEVSHDGAAEMALAEIRFWRATERKQRSRTGNRFSLATAAEIAFFPARYFLNRPEPAREGAWLRGVLETTIGVCLVILAWLLLVLLLFPSRVSVGILLAWCYLQALYSIVRFIRDVFRDPLRKPKPRTEFREHCMKCGYSLDGLTPAFDAAREIGPARCVECGHPWPRLA